MIITGISRYGEKASQKRPRYKIEVDGEYWYILSDVLIADFHLRKGDGSGRSLPSEGPRGRRLPQGPGTGPFTFWKSGNIPETS